MPKIWPEVEQQIVPVIEEDWFIRMAQLHNVDLGGPGTDEDHQAFNGDAHGANTDHIRTDLVGIDEAWELYRRINPEARSEVLLMATISEEFARFYANEHHTFTLPSIPTARQRESLGRITPSHFGAGGSNAELFSLLRNETMGWENPPESSIETA